MLRGLIPTLVVLLIGAAVVWLLATYVSAGFAAFVAIVLAIVVIVMVLQWAQAHGGAP